MSRKVKFGILANIDLEYRIEPSIVINYKRTFRNAHTFLALAFLAQPVHYKLLYQYRRQKDVEGQKENVSLNKSSCHFKNATLANRKNPLFFPIDYDFQTPSSRRKSIVQGLPQILLLFNSQHFNSVFLTVNVWVFEKK